MSDASSAPSRPTTPVINDPTSTPRPYRFTWDPASRKPGPESVSGTTEGRGGDDFGVGHPPLGFLNTSNLSLALGSLPNEWSSSRSGFHAISTVLNNPHKRQAPPKAHSSLPSVSPAELPRVRRKDFDSYLNSIGPEWERYERNTQIGQDGQLPLDSTQWTTPRNSIAGDEPAQPSTPMPSQTKYIPPLDSVPEVFFKNDFNLGDPQTFAVVTEQDAATAHLLPQDDAFTDPLALAHSLPLLEKFSHYADTVEQHLVREISVRSTSFFAALTNLHDLQSESEQCLHRISKLRTHLQDVDNNSARRGFEMVRKECKMANLESVQGGVKMIGGVVEMTAVVKDLVSAGQWGEALGVIEKLERMWDIDEPSSPQTATPLPKQLKPSIPNGIGNGHSHSLLPPTPEEDGLEENEDRPLQQELAHPPAMRNSVSLRSLHAFSALPSHLRALTMQIAASLSSEFVRVLRDDLDVRISGDGRADPDADQRLKDKLKPLLISLTRTKGLKEGVLSWREVVLVEVRGVIKTVLPDFNSAEEDNKTEVERVGLANHLRNMGHHDFISLIQTIYRSLLNGIEGLQAQGIIIVQVLDTMKEELGHKITDVTALEEDLADIVSSSAELANTQAAKVISYRAEQHSALELADFLTFFNDSWAFVVKCEVICRRMIVGLRGTVVGQAKLFLQAFHQTRLTHSAKRVEDEVWVAADITPGLQHIVEVLVDSAVRDPPELIIKPNDAIFSPQASEFPLSALNGSAGLGGVFPENANSKPTSNGPTAKATKHLKIDGRTYYAVAATVEVLTLLLDYMRVVVNLSMLTTDTMGRVIEFLRAFNSRTCQVVLGAGAMRSAGLKHISAKHLALASQSLSIVSELISYIRETFRRHLSQKQAVMLVEFDKMKRDFQEHQSEVHAKLLSIMSDRLKAHTQTLLAIDWNVPKADGGVNDYMQVLVSEITSLHKVLSRYLFPTVLEYIMTQVFADMNHQLSEAYGQIQLPHQEAKARLLTDVQYLNKHLAALKNVGPPSGMLEMVVQEKTLPRINVPSTPASPTPPTRSNTLTANQRLRGLLSNNSNNNNPSMDRALPRPPPTPPPPVPPQADKPQSPKPSSRNSLSLQSNGGSTSQHGLGLSPPIEESTTAVAAASDSSGPGFKQV